MNEIDKLYEALEEDQNNWVIRLAIADLYEEQGDDEKAWAVRWMVRNRKRPLGNGWFRGYRIKYSNLREDVRSSVDWDIWNRLETKVKSLAEEAKHWMTNREAEEELIRVLIKVKHCDVF